VYFSAIKIGSSDFLYLPFLSQIMVSPNSFIKEKEEWLQFEFQYKAEGGEQYTTIGNFTDSTEIDTLFVGGGTDKQWKETYYYIGDVYSGNCVWVPFDTGGGLNEPELISRNHRLYPNPATNQLNLAFVVKPNEQFSFLLYDLQGKMVQEQSLKAVSEHSIPIEERKYGLYFYQIRNTLGFLRGKLVVE
jgi:hypothetical protein